MLKRYGQHALPLQEEQIRYLIKACNCVRHSQTGSNRCDPEAPKVTLRLCLVLPVHVPHVAGSTSTQQGSLLGALRCPRGIRALQGCPAGGGVFIRPDKVHGGKRGRPQGPHRALPLTLYATITCSLRCPNQWPQTTFLTHETGMACPSGVKRSSVICTGRHWKRV